MAACLEVEAGRRGRDSSFGRRRHSRGRCGRAGLCARERRRRRRAARAPLRLLDRTRPRRTGARSKVQLGQNMGIIFSLKPDVK